MLDPVPGKVFLYLTHSLAFFRSNICNVCHTDETSTVGSHDSVNGFDLNNDDQVIHLVPSFVNKICVESGVNTI
ncbi:unnamed protein product [Rotaria sp. Silwood2]|nr:unnamed protein product [Rotaria sp. Silwood2]